MSAHHSDEQKRVMSAECVNLLARFVRIARHEEGADIHLQDKDIIAKTKQIADQTARADLKAIHRRLMQEYQKSKPDKASAKELQGATQLQKFAKMLGLN